MWWTLFAQAEANESPTIYHILFAVLGSGGLAVLLLNLLGKYMDHRKDLEIRRLDMEGKEKDERARQKAVEAEDRKAENRELKEASNELHIHYKQLIARFEKEVNRLGTRYEMKSAESIELRIQLEDALNKLRVAHERITDLESQLVKLQKADQ